MLRLDEGILKGDLYSPGCRVVLHVVRGIGIPEVTWPGWGASN